jgi:4-cresol dehydrogenase (hydroxylating)
MPPRHRLRTIARMPSTAKVSVTALQRALRACARVVGESWVLANDIDRDAYQDAYALGDGREHRPAAAVAPQSLEELQAIVQIANEFHLPLWPVARGKNLGYGGAAPLLAGSVVVDLGRMKRILEVDEKSGHCLLEPGVGFIDLHNHLRENGIKLWMSVPGNGWGSVVGNALERGIGYTPYGDHTAKICGMEVLLPTGELIRTGHGCDAGLAWLAALPVRLWPGLGPDVRTVQLRHRHEARPVADAGARVHHERAREPAPTRRHRLGDRRAG